MAFGNVANAHIYITSIQTPTTSSTEENLPDVAIKWIIMIIML